MPRVEMRDPGAGRRHTAAATSRNNVPSYRPTGPNHATSRNTGPGGRALAPRGCHESKYRSFLPHEGTLGKTASRHAKPRCSQLHAVPVQIRLSRPRASPMPASRGASPHHVCQPRHVCGLCLPSATRLWLMSANCDTFPAYVCQLRRFRPRTSPKSSHLADITPCAVALGRHNAIGCRTWQT